MLKPIVKRTHKFKGFVACDIENWPDGSVLTINTCWREAGQKVHARHTNWRDWWRWLTEKAISEPQFRCVYAHNGGGWDWLSFVHWLIHEENHPESAIRIVSVGSKIVVATVKVRDKVWIKLADSLQLLRSPLGSKGKPGDKGYKPGLAIKFTGRDKTDLGGRLPHEVYQQDRALFERYENEDTELLLEVLENALEILQKNVADIDGFSATIASTAMRVFRSIGFDKPIMVPVNAELKSFLRKAYTGGRVECFKPGLYDRIRVYDINSLYPYAMLTTKVPTTDRTIRVSSGYVIQPDDIGVFQVRFCQSNRQLPPVLMQKGAGSYEGELHCFSPELILLKEIDPKASIEVIDGYRFFDNSIVFKPFVQRLYSLRKSDAGGPLSELCKFLLNSLYGKFGQHPEKETIVGGMDFSELFSRVKSGEHIRPLNYAAGLYLDSFGKADKKNCADLPLPVYGLITESHCEFEHVGIAGMITSAARCQLYRGLLSAGFGRVVYCDTDSVHTTGELPTHLVGQEIGQFKIECEGMGAYAGKKLYALRFPGGEKVRAKGVSVGGRNGADLSFRDVANLLQGKRQGVVYSQPTTLMELLSGKNPCVFQKRKRTLSQTAKYDYGTEAANLAIGAGTFTG